MPEGMGPDYKVDVARRCPAKAATATGAASTSASPRAMSRGSSRGKRRAATYGRGVNRRQQKRQQARRRAHSATPDLPRNVISRASYSTVKQGHIIPATYQRNLAVDEMVAVHVLGRSNCGSAERRERQHPTPVLSPHAQRRQSDGRRRGDALQPGRCGRPGAQGGRGGRAPGLIPLAVAALDRIEAENSELLEMWQRTEMTEAFISSLAVLRLALAHHR
jgi:hypothetical protein